MCEGSGVRACMLLHEAHSQTSVVNMRSLPVPFFAARQLRGGAVGHQGHPEEHAGVWQLGSLGRQPQCWATQHGVRNQWQVKDSSPFEPTFGLNAILISCPPAVCLPAVHPGRGHGDDAAAQAGAAPGHAAGRGAGAAVRGAYLLLLGHLQCRGICAIGCAALHARGCGCIWHSARMVVWHRLISLFHPSCDSIHAGAAQHRPHHPGVPHGAGQRCQGEVLGS